ncbi:hypothetical protein R9X47_19370 [Wukongibacter baidiensis]|uniref:hypothetical protein n=1 Tax=Wukongibacter baidiensis TaxID=1723361 RepID=UPI003D7F21EE
MKWKKLGKIFEVNNNYDWMISHVSNPVVERISKGTYRIYFSTRDINNISRVGYIDVIPRENFKVINISNEAVLEQGELGTFDDRGVSIGCIVNFKRKKYLYYVGWNLLKTAPFMNSIGLAVYDEAIQKFKRCDNAPIIQRSKADPFSVSYPFIIKEDNKLRMWYGSHLTWGDGDAKNMKHCIKYAESKDGANWDIRDIKCINLYDNEIAVSRPFVIKDEGLYRMWYSYATKEFYNGKIIYRIGYAESQDGIKWLRKDREVGIDISQIGWDNESISYPFIFDEIETGTRYMLYNGNQYGKSGLGAAILVEE